MIAANLDQYLMTYGAALGRKIQSQAAPYHTPSTDAVFDIELKRPLLPAQSHVMTAAVKAMNAGERRLILNCVMGTGKTIMACAAAHRHAAGKPYRAIVVCPAHIAEKWKREILETIPNASVTMVDGISDLADAGTRPVGPSWYVVTQGRSKLATSWKPSYRKLRSGKLECPKCGEVLIDRGGKSTLFHSVETLTKNRCQCSDCGEQLWQYTHDFDRWAIADYVQRKLRHKFRYLVLDEVHQANGDTTAIGVAVSKLISSCGYTLALTGTILGGYAYNIRSLLFRLCPGEMIKRGLSWEGVSDFNKAYGRIETTIVTTNSLSSDNSQSKNGKQVKRDSVRPGIMPSLFELIMARTIFLDLEEIADGLPELQESVIGVPMDKEQAEGYEFIEREIKDKLKMLGPQGGKVLIGKMIHALLGWVDMPWGHGTISYRDHEENVIEVCETPDLSDEQVRPKELELIEAVMAERSQGRQVWVYTTMSGKYDVVGRLAKLLTQRGLRVAELRASVSTKVREKWIAKNAKADVVISHPKLVETGIDFFDKAKTYNFCSIIFYAGGLSIYTMRQAARRAFRIGQNRLCKVIYMYYEGTIQERFILLMGKKLAASMAMEGKFSEEGLLAMGGDDSIEMALAKSLSESIESLESGRLWKKITVAKSPVGLESSTSQSEPPKSIPPKSGLPSISQGQAIRKLVGLFD